MSLILSPKNVINVIDAKLIAVYSALLAISAFIPDLINVLMPFLHIDAVIISNEVITLTVGNIVTIVLFIFGAIAERAKHDGSAVEKKIISAALNQPANDTNGDSVKNQ